MDQVEDPRAVPRITYDKRFLLWWGLLLFLTKQASRRQLDYHLNTDGPEVLANVNRLAGTTQTTRPVNQTLDHFLGGIGAAPVADLRRRAIHRLLRMKALAGARVQGRYIVLIDGSGYLVFHHRHCPHCLTQRQGETTTYMHQVLEAKVVGPGGTVFSIGTEFIDNRDATAGVGAEQVKQDCELKALRRLMTRVRAEFPQLRICLSGDGLFGCGTGFQIAAAFGCGYVYTFQPGRLPALWQEFQALLRMCPDQRVEVTTPERVRQVYRWAALEYADSAGRPWTFTGIHCQESGADGTTREWAWVTSLDVDRGTVADVAVNGGRVRWRIENEGFNAQKTSGLNLEHAYSHTNWEAYYYLLQLAHLLLQLVEKGSLLQHLAEQLGRPTAVALFGSVKNIAQRLLESLRYMHWPDEVFDAGAAQRIQIRLNNSS